MWSPPAQSLTSDSVYNYTIPSGHIRTSGIVVHQGLHGGGKEEHHHGFSVKITLNNYKLGITVSTKPTG